MGRYPDWKWMIGRQQVTPEVDDWLGVKGHLAGWAELLFSFYSRDTQLNISVNKLAYRNETTYSK